MNKSDIGLELVKLQWQGANDSEREGVMLEMKRRGLSITDAIIALRGSGFYSLGEAKEYVSASPAWRREVENSREIQEIAWQVLQDFNAARRQR